MSDVAQNLLNQEAEKYIPEDYDPALYRIRHSAAHIMAQAVQERFGDEKPVHLGIGPPIEDGFYYDFELPRSLTPDDLQHIEERMKEIIRKNAHFEVRELTSEEARQLFQDAPYKLELLDGLSAGQADENGEALTEEQALRFTVYQQDTFFDLCRGPHVPATGHIHPDAIKLLNITGAYWRGDETRPMLQRIYGTAWATPEDLAQYLWRQAEAEKRDHRRIGKELELFHLDPTAPGMPYWLPKGLKILNILLDFWRRYHEQLGYQEISAPLINKKELWEISGHWDHYKDNMFLIKTPDGTTYGVKPMNCANAMVVYNIRRRSYRELPLRLSDCDVLHRHERSGTLHGLLRVQHIQQDDAHIFITEDQIEDEYDRVLDIVKQFYELFDLPYRFRLGTRPDKFLGDVATWDKAEKALKRILNKHVGEGHYIVNEKDGAFYGPKIDILMDDALGRAWQMGTIQLDFQLPQRFKCQYTDSNGQSQTPVVIHRVIYGSLERFIGILIEHTAGAFPVWLAPVQVHMIPIAARHLDYAYQVREKLITMGLRVTLDEENERMNAKVRRAQVQKVPYMVIIGDREVADQTVSVRLRTEENLGAMELDVFLERVQKVIGEKRSV